MRRAAKIDAGCYLGALCRKGHDHDGTGLSFRQKSGHCAMCVREAVAARFLANPELVVKEKERQQASELKHKDIRRAQNMARKKRNKDKIEARRRELYFLNHAKNLEKNAAKRERNRDAARVSQRESKRRQREVNIDAVRSYARDYYRRNSLRVRIRNRVYKAIKQQLADKIFTVDGYGIDVSAIVAHIGLCPGNHRDWHIDHIRPLSSFDLSDPDQVREAFSPENHQWLTAEENMQKAAKYG